jgi:hypothetical protein
MKIVRLVLLLSLVVGSAACNGASITEPDTSASVDPAPLFNGTAADTTVSRDGSGGFGSGT